MTNINLLPRKPFFLRYRLAISAVTVLLGVALLVCQGTLYAVWTRDSNRSAQQSADLSARLAVEQGNRQTAGKISGPYLAAKNIVDRLRSAQTQWMPVIALLLGNLPAGGSLIHMGTTGSNELRLELLLPTYEASVAYLQYIERSPLQERTVLADFSVADANGASAGGEAAGQNGNLSALLRKDAGAAGGTDASSAGTGGAASSAGGKGGAPAGTAGSAPAMYKMELNIMLQPSGTGRSEP